MNSVFPLLKELIGDWTDSFVLYIDLLGTKSRLHHARAPGRLRERQEVALTQTGFVTTLAWCAERFPSVRVEQLSDMAFAVCDDLEQLLSFTMNVFFQLTVYQHVANRIPVPARAAVARGIARFQSDKAALAAIGNLRHSDFIGYGMRDAYDIEQAGDRGMRLFLLEEMISAAPSWVQHRGASPRPDRDSPLFREVNWMRFSENGRWALEQPRVESALREIAKDWGTRAELRSALEDLLSWARSGDRLDSGVSSGS